MIRLFGLTDRPTESRIAFFHPTLYKLFHLPQIPRRSIAAAMPAGLTIRRRHLTPVRRSIVFN
ncbi:hypothetical protein [Martelella sp. AMO21009]